MNYAQLIENFDIDLYYKKTFPDTKYVRWTGLPDADTYVVHFFHEETIPDLLPFLQKLQTTICVVDSHDTDYVMIGMTYEDFEKLYDAAAPSLNYSYCNPCDKEYELIHSQETVDGELVAEGRTAYVIGNYQATDEGCEGCGKIVTSNQKNGICPNCGEEVYMS